MSLISIEQFGEFAEDYPELAQCYDLSEFEATQDDDFENWFTTYFN